MKKARIVGATGYGGVGLTELLLQHPEVEISALIATQDVGKRIDEVYPHLSGFCDLPVVAADSPEAQAPADIVFFATPDGVGMSQAAAALEEGAKVIDYSGDFRFNSLEGYQDYARRLGKPESHAGERLLASSVYGLPELHAAEIAKANLVGNVGCFAIGCILGMSPAVKNGFIDPSTLIFDCKTGVSGAGKKAAPAFHFPARQDNMNAYRLTGHQHVCEIERELGSLLGDDIQVTFTAQVVPANRGILAVAYAKLSGSSDYAAVLNAYKSFYSDKPFVRIFDRNATVGTQHVRGTNYCNLVVDVEERTSMLRIISHIDNLMKGQAGNALQNMNLMCGFPETMGLDRPGQYP